MDAHFWHPPWTLGGRVVFNLPSPIGTEKFGGLSNLTSRKSIAHTNDKIQAFLCRRPRNIVIRSFLNPPGANDLEGGKVWNLSVKKCIIFVEKQRNVYCYNDSSILHCQDDFLRKTPQPHWPWRSGGFRLILKKCWSPLKRTLSQPGEIIQFLPNFRWCLTGGRQSSDMQIM